MLTNASYFAFTATPKNKTLEIFGEPYRRPTAQVKHRPFHSYTMKQAIQEGFILDVLKNYTPVDSYYKLVKTVEADPEFDTKRAKKKLRHYVESHDHAIRLKAEIMVDHFHEQVLALNKIGGQARAMVVTQRHRAGDPVLPRDPRLPEGAQEPVPGHRRLLRRARVRRGEGHRGVAQRLPVEQDRRQDPEDPYRFLVCADKFQTGYDEPLLHTMYVDKPLSGIKAVQTLSRLNRAHPKKHDVFVLDFMNDADTIQAAFADYYRTTILSEETDPNKLHDLKAALDGYQVYAPSRSTSWSTLYLGGADRDQLDPILDACVATYKRAARRGRPGRLQGQGQGVHPHLRLPRLDPAVHQRRLGEALDLPELPDPEAARARSRKTYRRASSKRSTWTATGSRSRRR